MKGDTARKTVTVTNPQGFHMRPAQEFVLIAGPYAGTVNVCRPGDPPVSGKSILGLLTLGAEQNQVLEVEVTGPDAKGTLEKLLHVFEKTYDEETEPAH